VSSASAVEISSNGGEEKAAEEKFCPDIAALFLVSRRQEQPQSSGHVWLIALSHASADSRCRSSICVSVREAAASQRAQFS
jgi:hypothetical protein